MSSEMFSAEEMAKHPASWLDASGENGEIVLSSRVRVARNLHEHRFTHHCSNEELSEILRETWSAAGQTRVFARHRFIPMGDISTLDRQFLAERHLVSREFLFNSSNRGLVVNSDENLCLMINEEDHLRIQGFAAGFAVETAYQRARALDSELSPKLHLAFSERFGYLTACPTNLGTGLRVSVLIHLPGLVHSKEINKLLESLRKLNHSIRGLYGEGTEVMGNFFQLSNSATLGTTEEAIVKGLREMVGKVISFEEKAREMLFRKARSLLEDKVWRAYGLLRYARSVSTKEALSLISAVRMGVGMGVLEGIPIRTLNELLIYTQPAHLQEAAHKTMDERERDIARAEYMRRALAKSAN
jgi:protein arginine kinase